MNRTGRDRQRLWSRAATPASTSRSSPAAASGSSSTAMSGRRGPRLGRLGRSTSRPLSRAGDSLARLAPAAPRQRSGFGRGERTERLLRATSVGSFSITRNVQGACRQQVNECLHRRSPVGRLGWPGDKERIAAGACSAIGRWPYAASRPYLKESPRKGAPQSSSPWADPVGSPSRGRGSSPGAYAGFGRGAASGSTGWSA